MDMTKEEALKLMVDSTNEDNRVMCEKTGMSQEETEAQIAQSQPSLVFIMSNIYDKLKAAGAIV
jgi:hypothetical protein